MFEELGYFYPNRGIAGNLEGEAKLDAVITSNSMSRNTALAMGVLRCLEEQGAKVKRSSRVETAPEIFDRLWLMTGGSSPSSFLRELLATFHRISNLPNDISMEDERLYA